MTDFQIILLMLLFSAFFSGMEIAFVSANRLRIELDLKKKKISAGILNGFYKNPSKFIGALLLGNNIALVVYGIAMARLLEPIAESFPAVMQSQLFVLLFQTVVSTLIILFFAEFLPKILFRINPNGMLSAFAGPVWLFFYLLYPLIVLYISLAEFLVSKVFRIHLEPDEYKFSSVDLNDFIRDYASDEQIEDEINQDIQLFQKAIDFRYIKLRECMVPRTEIEAVNVDDTLNTLLNRFEETKHSKILVYQDSIDNIIGYVHSFDMFKKPADIKQVLRPIEIYPETYAANLLLSQLIQKRRGIAVVVDEFGGTSGIVSMEDIIEEIFGNIDDEYDEEETVELRVEDHTYVFSARLEIDYLNQTYKLNLPESEEYETLAGFIINNHESIPALGEEIIIDSYKISILKAAENKILEVQLELL
ncbi:MAG: hemolysin family protein [Bacteroidales bacterium]|jgi:CBS domain containing-hemolysin-like protein|nr:hemolysin family protein [Bacteroidales bacterium]